MTNNCQQNSVSKIAWTSAIYLIILLFYFIYYTDYLLCTLYSVGVI